MIGEPFTILATAGSTNNYAMEQVYDGKAGHGWAVLALEQTAGKGQRGRAWHTGRGVNMALSVVLQPRTLTLAQQFLLSAAVACAVRNLLQQQCPGFTIKWPNDLYFNDRKAGGILIENKIQGPHWQYAVAGIGLNVNQEHFPDALPNAISLRQLSGHGHSLEALARDCCRHLQTQWEILLASPDQVLAEYRRYLYKRGETVRLRKDNRVFSSLIYDVNEEGQLLTGEHGETAFSFGEVQWVIESQS
jgi:BirA family transcriptional regulator, biotin operon repressor / biotin---[acetyl-CoA-carboxylase] ligase